MRKREGMAGRKVIIGLELLVDAEASMAALLRNLEAVLSDYARVREPKGHRPRERR